MNERLVEEELNGAYAAASSTEELEGTPGGFVYVPSCLVRGAPPQDRPGNQIGTCRVRRLVLDAGSGIDLVNREDVK